MENRKNILLYFTDQQRADTCGCYGQELPITPVLDQLAREGTRFDLAFTAQPVCGPCRALFQTGKWPTETGCFRNNIMLPADVKPLGAYMEEAGYETAYIGKWHLASDGELEQKPTIDHTITAIPRELRGGYTGFWRTSDVLEFTSHGYDGFVFDENNNRIDFTGYRVDCITDLALEFFDQYDGQKPFFMTISHIEPHHQNDHQCYEGPVGSKEKYANYKAPADLEALGGNYKEEYPDYLGQCAYLDENLGRMVAKLKEKGLYEDTVIIAGDENTSNVTQVLEKVMGFLIGDLLPAENTDSETAETEETAETAEPAEADATEEESKPQRYFMLEGGKIVYILDEANLSAALS